MTNKKQGPQKSFSSGNDASATRRPLKGAIVFLHAKAHVAQTLEERVTQGTMTRASHPVAPALTDAIHCPVSDLATRESEINQAERVILVIRTTDVPIIAEHIDVPTFHLRFDNQFPREFTLIDPFPEDMFTNDDAGKRHYVGPSFDDLLEPATWVTTKIPIKDKKPKFRLRNAFLGQWLWVRNVSAFVNCQQPLLMLKKDALDFDLASLSHKGSNPRGLLLRQHESRVDRFAYRPGRPTGLLNIDGETCFNTWRSTRILPARGDIEPFDELMEHLFPSERDRHQVRRWLMTLIAKPERKLAYSLLLVSETQGTGRNTLADQIVAPLVGRHNCSWPNQSAVMSDFNEWRINIRLAIISEIHVGHGWKMYKMLQDVITDEFFMAHRKNFSRYRLESFIHIIGISNSLRALVLAEDERRWLVPQMAGVKLPLDKATALRAWLVRGGLQAILYHALAFDDYVREREEAPTTWMKTKMAEDTTSEHVQIAQRIAQALGEFRVKGISEPAALAWTNVRLHLKTECGEMKEPDTDVRREMGKEAGVFWITSSNRTRIWISSTPEHVLINDALYELIKEKRNEERNAIIRKHVMTVHDIALDGDRATSPSADAATEGDGEKVTSFDDYRNRRDKSPF
jgi:hypothetical protein